MAKTTLRDYLQHTEDAISSGRVDEALANCQYILTRFPESLEAQRLLGEVYLAQGQLQEAQQTFDWVLTNDPENVIAYCDRALISERLSDLDTALDCYQQAYELSRGNSQIRQEFNQLSAKAGQQGFMFSRAGLARLYMRGDLLTQAIQEWEVVLASSPDRLDARTGLLEAYWREGYFEQAEQLARQIIEDIPGCLKALLLLAHVTSAKNSQQARELIQQAKALDPDMAMAQDLFGDLAASQSHDPFLSLLQLEPTVFLETTNGHSSPAVNVVSTQPSTPANSPAFAESLLGWSGMDTMVEPPREHQPAQEASALNTWSGNAQDADPWATPGQQDYQPQQEEQTWHMGQRGESALDSLDPWSNFSNQGAAKTADPWGSEVIETDLPTPPAWLDMLTKSEQRQPGDAMAALPPVDPVQPEPPLATPLQPASSTLPTWDDIPHATSPSGRPGQDDESPFFFGPEWLKSLGAASLDSPSLPASETAAADVEPIFVAEPPPGQPRTDLETNPPAPFSADQTEHPALPQRTTQAASSASFAWNNEADSQSLPSWTEEFTRPTAPSWSDQSIDPLAQPVSNAPSDAIAQSEQEYLATLENLEQDLRSQGFTSLEPGALSTQPNEQEPSLSSALAELKRYASQSGNAGTPVPALQQPITPVLPPAEPLWPATPPQAPTPPAPVPVAYVTPEPVAPSARPEIVPDDELEITMKRPAIRLQSAPQRIPGMQTPDPNALLGKGRSTPGKPTDGTLSYRDRLLRGYQYQLAGAYDDAMQEYRIIIRSAPELLGDVVSNMRALLKLAPKYSAGYRVLGDAYMRQGEYLQAMEAYNKALTMAKKAKG